MEKIELENLTKEFDDITAVDSISLSIQDGEFFTIVGPSGCGKSTTLRMIAGFEEPTAGRVKINGNDVTNQPPNERDVGLVFQDYALFPHMTAAENIAFGLQMQEVPESAQQDRIDDVLELVDLPGVGSQYPEELSGGQQQRIALARALVIEPDVLLLDEPLSNLDKQLRESLQIELKRIQQETNVTTIHVTHNQEEAMTLADRMCVLNNGQVEQVASPRDVYNHPKTPFVSEFVGKANAFGATVERTDDTVSVELTAAPLSFQIDGVAAEELQTMQEGLLVVRPERIQLSALPDHSPPRGQGTQQAKLRKNQFRATVRDRQFKGEKTRYELSIDHGGSQDLEMTAHAESGFEPGETVLITVDASELIFIPHAPNNRQ